MFRPGTVHLFGVLTLALSLVAAVPAALDLEYEGGRFVFVGSESSANRIQWAVVLLAVPSAAAAYAYTGGPYPLGYHALGDATVFFFFGVVAVALARRAHLKPPKCEGVTRSVTHSESETYDGVVVPSFGFDVSCVTRDLRHTLFDRDALVNILGRRRSAYGAEEGTAVHGGSCDDRGGIRGMRQCLSFALAACVQSAGSGRARPGLRSVASGRPRKRKRHACANERGSAAAGVQSGGTTVRARPGLAACRAMLLGAIRARLLGAGVEAAVPRALRVVHTAVARLAVVPQRRRRVEQHSTRQRGLAGAKRCWGGR